jgi:type I restriction enzyme S subunit
LIRLMSRGMSNEPSIQTQNLKHPQSWPAVRLDSVSTVERGKFSHRPRNLPQFYGGPYPFVQTGDVGASRGKLSQVSQTLSDEGLVYSRSFPENTILITIAAVIGATAITTEEIWCTDSVVGIVANDTIDVRFLEYVLRYIRPYLEFQVATQTAQKNINLKILRPMMIPCPSLQVQKAIVDMLRESESAMELLDERLELCRSIAQNVQQKVFSGV